MKQMDASRFRFRAWNKYAHCMVDLHKITPIALEIDPTIAGGGWGVYVPDHPDLILMQSTGLQDKNGKEIFEGDIIGWENPVDGNTQALVTYGVAQYTSGFNFGMSPNIVKFCEVIGNIYENSELLKEKE